MQMSWNTAPCAVRGAAVEIIDFESPFVSDGPVLVGRVREVECGDAAVGNRKNGVEDFSQIAGYGGTNTRL